ncbi:golgin subfamily A member 6-like protein 6 [Diprion similis]|uniref:golgin subfamily A member 6-like protein 6 n=1 Tax=Diprion similis TaxID=362088 RepID=UPI001EF95CCE|nr:golgin subfamily A member 6-like protein 6 [Diprion similis]
MLRVIREEIKIGSEEVKGQEREIREEIREEMEKLKKQMCKREQQWIEERRELRGEVGELGKRLEAVELRKSGELENEEERLAKVEQERIADEACGQKEGVAGMARKAIETVREMEWSLERKERGVRRENIILKRTNIVKGKEKEGVQVGVMGMWEVGAKGVWVAKLGSRDQKRQVMEKKRELRRRIERIEDDLTWVERKMQWKLREIASTVKQERSRVRVGYGKLWIDGEVWKWDELGEVLRDVAGRVRGVQGVVSDVDGAVGGVLQEGDLLKQGGTKAGEGIVG